MTLTASDRATRAITLLGRATEVLIHAVDEQHLLTDICKSMVESGGHQLAWIGFTQHDPDRTIWPVARAGEDQARILSAPLSWSDGHPRGLTPPGQAIRSGQLQIGCLETLTTTPAPAGSPQALWPSLLTGMGLTSWACLPLRTEGRVMGLLTILSADPDAFNDDVVRVLDTLARNLGYGIGMQRLQFERRRAERELKESEGRYRSLVELSPDAIVVHAQGVITFANSAANQLFACPDGPGLIGRRLLDQVHGEKSPQTIAALETDEGFSAMIEEQFLRLDGKIFHAEVTAAPIIFHGMHARQVVMRDITERKLVHAQLIQTAKLATLGEMAAGTAHELSQPTNIIRMAADAALMQAERGKASPETLIKQLSMISAQAARMAEIIDHIRIFSRKDASELMVFDALHSLRLASELLGPQFKGKEITLTHDLPDRPCMVRGRPVQLEQVIINLLANAADAITMARAEFGFYPGAIHIDASVQDNRNLRLIITDNGSGISDENLQRIFEPFFTTKDVGKGTGLGLSVSIGIITGMGGALLARNAEDSGAEFEVTLPLCHDSESPGPLGRLPVKANPLAGQRYDGVHLLLVDDEPMAVETMSAYLEEFGFRLSTATSGNSAFALFAEDPADLLITDIRMPDGGGDVLARRLRSLEPDLPVIVVSGHMGANDKIEGLRNTKNLVLLRKPLSLQALGEAVETLLKEKSVTGGLAAP